VTQDLRAARSTLSCHRSGAQSGADPPLTCQREPKFPQAPQAPPFSSTMRCRNSGAYGQWLFGIVDLAFRPNDEVSTKPVKPNTAQPKTVGWQLIRKLGGLDARSSRGQEADGSR